MIYSSSLQYFFNQAGEENAPFKGALTSQAELNLTIRPVILMVSDARSIHHSF